MSRRPTRMNDERFNCNRRCLTQREEVGTGLTRHASRAPLLHFAGNRHESCGRASQHSGKNLAGFVGHGTGDIQMRDGTKTVAADGIDQEPFML